MNYPEILTIEATGSKAYDEDDAILYALALGFGAVSQELPFVFETGLKVVPSMNVLLATGAGAVMDGGGLDYRMIVHGEQRLTIHRPLPPAARVTSRSKCVGVTDKGAGKGAVVDIETVIADAADGLPYSTQLMSLFCRGDGGQGGASERALSPAATPERPPDHQLAIPTMTQQAALYRLTGDRNPLHIDPAIARAVGFDRPILHGLCTYGMVCRAILREFCDYRVERLSALEVRFAGPLYPGETLLLRLWQDGSELRFEAGSQERETRVLSNGRCRLSD